MPKEEFTNAQLGSVAKKCATIIIQGAKRLRLRLRRGKIFSQVMHRKKKEAIARPPRGGKQGDVSDLFIVPLHLLHKGNAFCTIFRFY